MARRLLESLLVLRGRHKLRGFLQPCLESHKTMEAIVNVRGFTPRSWKTKSGETKHAANFVLLDLSPSPIMETIAMAVEYEGEAQVRQAAELVGKTCLASITSMRVGMNGKPELLGSIVAKK